MKVTIIEKAQEAAAKAVKKLPTPAPSKKLTITPKTEGPKAKFDIKNLKPGQKVKVTIKEGNK